MGVVEISLSDKRGRILWSKSIQIDGVATLSVGRSGICDLQCSFLAASEWAVFSINKGFVGVFAPDCASLGFKEIAYRLRRHRILNFRLRSDDVDFHFDLDARPDFSIPSILSWLPGRDSFLNRRNRLVAARVLMDDRLFGALRCGYYDCSLRKLMSVFSDYAAVIEDIRWSSRERLLALLDCFWMLAAHVYAEGPLTRWLRTSGVREVLIHGHSECWLEDADGLHSRESPFESWDDVWAWLVHHATLSGRELVNSRGCADFHLGVGARVHVALPPVAGCSGYVCIRRHLESSVSLERMVHDGFLTSDQRTLLIEGVTQRKNILICGSTSSGKTTLLRTLAECVPAHERIVVLEDVPELRLAHAHSAYLRAVESRPGDAGGDISLESLLREALRMRPDRLIVGECRGDEAFSLVQALNTGHSGSFATLHANSPADALRRLEALVLRAEPSLNSDVVRKMILSAFDVVVFLERVPGHVRRVGALCSTGELQ